MRPAHGEERKRGHRGHRPREPRGTAVVAHSIFYTVLALATARWSGVCPQQGLLLGPTWRGKGARLRPLVPWGGQCCRYLRSQSHRLLFSLSSRTTQGGIPEKCSVALLLSIAKDVQEIPVALGRVSSFWQ